MPPSAEHDPSHPPPADLTPEAVVWAYQRGYFPMAQNRDGPTDWYTADPRTILPLESFHVSRSLVRRLRRGTYRITLDHAFEQVIRACAQPRPYADQTWINDQIVRVYTQLHHLGIGHSVEAWLAEDATTATADNPAGSPGRLVGGIYGLALGGAFFGESMFSRATDASKVCLAHLVEHLRWRGFGLFDVQLSNPHLEQFGIVQISRRQYLRRLHAALKLPVTW